MRSLILVFAIISITFASCYYDNEEELYPNVVCATDSMSYSIDVVPIFTNNSCFNCHTAQTNFGNVDLSTYAEVIKYVNNGSLVGSIEHSSSFSAMPQGASKMNNCNISKVKAWISQGAKNN